MNASATAAARIAGIVLVLVLAAVFGVVVGNLLAMRDAGAAVGAGASTPHMSGFDGARYEIQRAAMREAPAYADPYRQIIEEAGSQPRTESLTAPTPR